MTLVILGVVIWQTWLVRRSVKLTETTLEEAQRAKELSNFSHEYLILEVRARIERWRTDLQRIIDEEEYIRTQIRADDNALGTKYGRKDPKGLIVKFTYELSPAWLQSMIEASAQFYFDCKAIACALSPDYWSENGIEMALKMLPSVIERARIGVDRLTEILSYMQNMLPKWYLESPASLGVSAFLDTFER